MWVETRAKIKWNRLWKQQNSALDEAFLLFTAAVRARAACRGLWQRELIGLLTKCCRDKTTGFDIVCFPVAAEHEQSSDKDMITKL